MIRISKGEPLLFWPSHVCDTFPHNPGNRYLTGEHYWEVRLDFRLPEITTERQSIMTLLPHYTAFEVEGDHVHLSATMEGSTQYQVVHYPLEENREYVFTWLHLSTGILVCCIDDEQIGWFGEDGSKLDVSPEPHLIFGAGNFPKNKNNLNFTEVDLHMFRLWVEQKILSYVPFDEMIFDKYVDRSGNCNFINKI